MLKKIVELCVKNSITIAILTVAFIMFGTYTLQTARMDVFPDFAPPQVVIQTEVQGFTAELTEMLVTKPIENELSGLAGITSMRSQSSSGLSVVTIIFSDSQDPSINRQIVAERLSTVSRKLPNDVAIPMMTPLTSSASSVLGIGFTSKERDLIEQTELVKELVIPRLREIKGVADINIFGGEARQRKVKISPSKMFAANISLEELTKKIEESIVLQPSGYLENENQRIEIFANGQPQTIEDLSSLVIKKRDSRPLILSDIAIIEDSAGPVISTANINGVQGVFLMVQALPKSDTIRLTKSLEDALVELKPALQVENLELHSGLFRPANFIEEATLNVQKDILLGAGLVLAILLLFLFNARAAIISAIAIPISLLSSITILVLNGITLNIMVPGGLVIALGEVVDDAIIDTENIFRRLRENKQMKSPKSTFQVIVEASLEVRHSIIFATLIVIFAFSPLLFLPGVVGRLFEPLGLAYIFALASSLVVALTITPALCAIYLKNHEKLPVKDSPTVIILKSFYKKILTAIEKYPKQISWGSIFVIFIGLGTIPLFKMQFIPDLREGHYIVHMTAIPGTSPQEMNRVGKLVTKKIRDIENVKSTAQWVGRAEQGADTFGMNYSEIQVEVGPLTGKQQEKTVEQIKKALSEIGNDSRSAPFPGFTFGIHTFLSERIEETVSGYTADFVIEIVGNNLEDIQSDAKKIVKILTEINGAHEIEMVSPPNIPQVKVEIKWDKLAALGMEPDEVIRVITTVFHGTQVAEIVQSFNTVPVVISFQDHVSKNVENIKKFSFKSANGTTYKLQDIANIYFTTGKSKILRNEGKRIQAITLNLSNRDFNDFDNEVKNQIKNKIKLSKGNYIVYRGSSTEYETMIKSLFINCLLAFLAVCLTLRIALYSNINLLIVLLNLPFCLIGGVFAIVFGGGWLSIGSLVGFVTLFGITIRNSIMLISHFQNLVLIEKLPWNFQTALKGSSERLPSILMTAIVTGLGLLPLVLGSGEPGREIEGPMASIIVGGLISSTLLNLLILPTLLVNYGSFSLSNSNFKNS